MGGTVSNWLSRQINRINFMHKALRPRLLSMLMGRIVPFVGTAGVKIEEMTEERVVASLRNKRKVRNHIRGLHAAAMTLAAETATGFVVVMNLPEGKLPLMKSLKVDFVKRATGGMRFVAELNDDQRAQMRDEPKGAVTVKVNAKDDMGQECIRCEMIWAWVPKKRKAQ